MTPPSQRPSLDERDEADGALSYTVRAMGYPRRYATAAYDT